MSISGRLEDIISSLKGSIKTRQQDAVKQLLSLLSDSSSGLIPYLNAKTKFVPQNVGKNHDEENQGWNYLIINFLEYFVQAVANSKDKKTNYDSLTLNPAVEALKQISIHFRNQQTPIMLNLATVDAFYKMIADTAELAHSKLLLPKIRESFQNILLKVDVQCQMASQAPFLGAVFALLQTLNASPQTRGGFQKLTELLRVIILSNGFASMKRKRPKRELRLWQQFQDLFCSAATRTLEFSQTDPQCARDMVLIFNYLLKNVLYHDLEGLAKPAAQALNGLIATRLADPKANESLCQSIISCFRIQLRVFIRIDGTFDDIPDFAAVASSVHSAFLRSFTPLKAKVWFATSSQDRLIRMDPACLKLMELFVDTMLRLRDRNESWDSVSRAESTDAPSAKRRKTNSGDDVMSSFVESFVTEKDADVCSWMRCLLILLNKYPNVVPSSDMLKLAENIRDRFSRSYNLDLEVVASYCLASLVTKCSSNPAPALVAQSIESLIGKLVKAKPGGPVAESCLRALIAIFRSPFTSTILASIPQETIVPQFTLLWKSNLFAQPSFSVCAALCAKLCTEFSRVCGSPEEADQYADWALKTLSIFINQQSSSDDMPYAVPFFGSFVGALAGVNSVNQDYELPDFASFFTSEDRKEDVELTTLEKLRSLGFPSKAQKDSQYQRTSAPVLGEFSVNSTTNIKVLKLVSEFIATHYSEMSTDAKASPMARQKLALVAFHLSSIANSEEFSNGAIQASMDSVFVLASAAAPDTLTPLEIRLLRASLGARLLENSASFVALKKYIHSRISRHGNSLVASALASQLQATVEKPNKRDSSSNIVIDHDDDDVMDLDDSFNAEGKTPEKRESLSGELPNPDSAEAETVQSLIHICLMLMQDSQTADVAQKVVKQVIPTVSPGTAFLLLEHLSNTPMRNAVILDFSSRLLRDLSHREKLPDSLLLLGTSVRQRILTSLTSHIRQYQDLALTKEPHFKTLIDFAAHIALQFLSALPLITNSEEICFFVDLLEQMILHCSDEGHSETFMSAMLELQQTPDFAVRQQVSLRLPCLFQIVEEVSGPFQVVKDNLPSHEPSYPEDCGAAILLLSNILQHSPSLEHEIVSHMFKMYGVPKFWPVIRVALGSAANVAHMESLLDYLCPHLSSILQGIKATAGYSEASPLLNDVASGIFLADRSTIFNRAPAQIILFCAFEGDRTLLLEMCKSRGLSLEEVVLRAYCGCLEALLPLIAQRDKGASKALSFLEQLAPKEDMHSRLAMSVGKLIGRLLVDQLEPGLHPSIQEFLAARFRIKSPSILHYIIEKKQTHFLLLSVTQLAARRPNGADKAFNYMMEFAASNRFLSKLSVIHPLIFAAIRLKRYDALAKLLESAAESGPDDVALIQSVFDLIVSHVLDAGDDSALDIVRFLYDHSLSKSLANCAILPSKLHESLKDSVAKQQSIISEQLEAAPVETLISALVAAKQWHLPASVRAASLRVVANGLSQAGDIPTETRRKVVTQIISLIKRSSVAEITSMAAECLTRIPTALLPQLFDVSLSEDEELNPFQIDQFKFKTHDSSAMIKIVRELLVLMHSRDSSLAEAATRSLTAVLTASKDMSNGPIKSNIDNRLLDFALEHIAAEPIELDYRPPSNNIFTWQAADSSDSWMRRVTYDLLRATDHPAFNACKDVALLCLPFCEIVFPYAFTEASRRHPTELASAITASILEGQEQALPHDVYPPLTRAFVVAHRNSLAIVEERRRSLELEYRRGMAIGARAAGQTPLAQLKTSLKESCFVWVADPFWKSLNLIQVSKACLAGGSPLAALHFYEQHSEREGKKGQSESELLVDIYSSINDPDNSRSLSSLSGHNIEWRIQTLLYTQEAKWQNAMMLFNDQLASSESIDQRAHLHLQIAKALLNDGQTQVAETYLSGLSVSDPQISKSLSIMDLRAQLAWRLKRWEALPSGLAPSGQHLNALILKLLSLLNGKDRNQYDRVLESFRSRMLTELQNLKLYSSENIIQAIIGLHQLQSFTLAGDWVQGTETVRHLPSTWLSHLRELSSSTHALETMEPLLATHQAIMQEMMSNLPPVPLIKFTRAKASLFRENARHQLASASLRDMNMFMTRLEKVSRATYLFHILPSRLEEAQVAWSRGEKARAVQLVKNLLSFSETDGEFLKLRQKLKQESQKKHAEELHEALAMAHAALGDWLSQTQMESSAQVQTHLEKAVSFFSALNDSARGHFELATFLDSRLAAMQEAELSTEAATERQVMEARKEAVVAAQRQVHKDPAVAKLLQRVAADEQQARETREKKTRLVSQLFKEWLAVLWKSGDDSKKHILHAVFRAISIWTGTSRDRDDLSRMLKSALDTNLVLPNRFLPLFYQLASRISASQTSPGSSEAAFQKVLTVLIEKIATSNPHRSLPVLFALTRLDIVMGVHAKHYNHDVDKMQAAKTLWNNLRGKNGFTETVDQSERLLDAYVELAFLDPSACKTDPQRPARRLLTSNMKLVKLKNLDRAGVPTYNGGDEKVPVVSEILPYFELVGGITAPKAIYCRGSDGNWYKQLVKGPAHTPTSPTPDDLRQDAVMQQAFTLINSLLSLDTAARSRALRMRSYRVVPLTPAAGVLEWVTGTSPILDYLVGASIKVGDKVVLETGAHQRYHPADKLHAAIRNEFNEMKSASASDKQDLFDKTCQNFHPVFHNFFIERFPSPMEWYLRRLAYTRSVATSSMVGYIIGLGDRHSSNILIDNATAELVHIDLGVAFEQGKQLPIPELVPFRLTRDLVHGMGVAGTEGVFSDSCERTMSVMRQQRQFIENIVEVFLHDPLFKWSVAPGRAQRLQRDDSFDGPDGLRAQNMPKATLDATSTILRLKHKLRGTDYGDALSVEGQVRKLIQDAVNPELLSKMYYGWAPWL